MKRKRWREKQRNENNDCQKSDWGQQRSKKNARERYDIDKKQGLKKQSSEQPDQEINTRETGDLSGIFDEEEWLAEPYEESEVSNNEAYTQHGTTRFVYVRVHPAFNTYPLLSDSSAGISLIPKRWYDSIPVEKRPKLKTTTLNVRTDNKVRINVTGVIKTELRLQCGDSMSISCESWRDTRYLGHGFSGKTAWISALQIRKYLLAIDLSKCIIKWAPVSIIE